MMEILGKTPLGTEIQLHRFGGMELPKLLLIGGVHGDEPEGVGFVTELLSRKEHLRGLKYHLMVIPELNPDGLKINQRTNSNGVDLNRNFPTVDWSSEARAPRYFPGKNPASETETQILLKLITVEKPVAVLHCHSYLPQLVYSGPNSKIWAEKLGKGFPFPIKEDIGYPTPGSLGQYCALQAKLPCVCIEFPENITSAEAWKLMGTQFLELVLHGS